MAEIRPFRGIRYDTALAGPLDKVLAPPYDVISPAQHRKLLDSSPYNIVRVELTTPAPSDTPQDNTYTRAAAVYDSWLKKGVLAQDKEPSLYMVRHQFPYRGATARRRELTVALKLEDLASGVVRPHEATGRGAKEDRMALMRAAKASVSPIMLLYSDASGNIGAALDRLERQAPTARAHALQEEDFSLWATSDKSLVSAVQAALRGKPVYIADGHHRYETSVEYLARGLQDGTVTPADEAARYVLATLMDKEDPGVMSLPYNRILKNLTPEEKQRLRPALNTLFTQEDLSLDTSTLDAVGRRLETRPDSVMAVIGLDKGKASILSSRPDALRKTMPGRSDAWRSIAPCIFAEAVLPQALGLTQPEAEAKDKVDYFHEADDTVRTALAGGAVAFLLKAVPLTSLMAVADAGERFPRKSTYFYPKLPTGLVLKSLQGGL